MSVLNVEEHDLAVGLPFSILGGLFMMASYYYIQPLSDVLAISMGMEYTPLVTIGNMLLIIGANPLYALVVRNLETKRVVPVIYRFLMATLLFFAMLFFFLPQVQILSFLFAVYVGTFSLFLTTTFWARMASLHTKVEAKRMYGKIASGAQCGQLFASVTAASVYSYLNNTIVVVSAVLLELCVQMIVMRGKAADESTLLGEKTDLVEAKPKVEASDEASDPPKTCSVFKVLKDSFKGFQLLVSTPMLRAITGHTLLITFLVSGVWYERGQAVSNAFDTTEERYAFFAWLNSVIGIATLVMQVFFFSHVLKFLGFHGTLLTEPIIIAIGLMVAAVYPGLLSIAFLDGARKVVHYSLLKPTKEGLYAALPKDTQFVAKPLLDTLVYRSGSLIGAAYFELMIQLEISSAARRYFLMAVAVCWAINSYVLGKLAEESQLESDAPQGGASGREQDHFLKSSGDSSRSSPSSSLSSSPSASKHAMAHEVASEPSRAFTRPN